MRERVEELKGRVRTMFSDNDSVAKAVTLIDTLERLGVDGHFREEIASAISRIAHPDESSGSNDLHVVATRFRLLRQHGIWVSTGTSTIALFTILLRDMLYLLTWWYPVTARPSRAIDFTRHQLEAIAAKGELRSPVAEQIARALDHPLPRFTRLLESMYYVGEYAQEETHNNTLLELARLNAHLMRYLHLRELKALSLWWRDLYDMVNLPYTRDRMVEVYFWSCGMIPEEEYSRARLMFAKTFGLVTFLDDTYDVHATLEECRSFTEAIQRWDNSAVSILPEYLRVLYIKTLSNFKDFENMLKPHEKYRMSYAKKAYQLQAEYYMQEAQWSHDKHQPTFREHEELSVMSSGLPMLNLVALMGYGAIATNKVFEWTCAVPDVVRAGAQIGRFLNDISSYKLGKNKKDVASVVESYMVEKGTTGEEAVAAIAAMTEDSWRMMNQACMDVDRALLPAAQLVVNIARSNEVIYLRGRDGYTFGSHVKDLVTMLFLAPIPL
ncbi:terpene synthase [Hordeum vulgare]|nr:terpene synthase [Hordeum vulgare]